MAAPARLRRLTTVGLDGWEGTTGGMTIESGRATELPAEQRKVVTIMYADLSGSTAMAERMDPEEVRGVLASYFGALAHEIHRFGGSIDKYIGDAVRALFESPASVADEAQRAVGAGLAMQQAIGAQNEELERRYGIRLSLRIGIETGEVVLGSLLGGIQSAETLVGEAVDLAHQLEAAAVPSTVLVGANTHRFARRSFRFEPAPPEQLRAKAPGLRAYRAAGRKRRAAAPEEGSSAERRTLGVSASLQVGEQKAHALEEQRKVVTVLFADLATPISTHLDPQRVREVLGVYFSVVARQIQRYGGTIDKYIGDAVMSVFGAPIAREDDAARAINAALAIQVAMKKENDELERKYGIRLSLRIGVNTGEVVAGLLAGEVVAYTVTGDAVNTAQRLESVAPADEILAGQQTYQLARRSFVFQAVPPIALKGKTEPVPAFRVVMRERRAVPREAGPPFVGRAEELSWLRALFESASAGRGGVVHVSGEAGVGKSRLLLEFFAGLLPTAARLRPRCTSFESSTPYALAADLFRRAFAIQPGDEESSARNPLATGFASLGLPSDEGTLALVLEVLGYGERSLLDPETKRRILTSLMHRFLARKSAAAPLVVVAEDIHWIDSSSASLFTDVLKDVPSFACLFVSTSRDESVPWSAEHLALRALDESAASELLNRLATSPLDAKLRQTLLERTAGNPFFLEEVVRSLGGRTTGTVPANVQELLQARLDDLSPSAKRIAQRAAVIGRYFSTRVLAELTPEEPLEVALAELEREGFVAPRAVSPEVVYGFRHALFQEAAYQVQLMAQRRVVHGRVGGAVEALYEGRLEEFVDVLAFHYGRSDNDDKAVDWQVRAGDRARRLFANDEAISLFTAALQRLRDGAPVDAPSILERIGDVQTLVGKYKEAIESFRTAQRRTARPAPEVTARFHRKVGHALRVKGEYREASAACAEGLAALGGEGHPEAARIGLEVGQLHWRGGDYAAAQAAFSTSVDIAQRLGAEEVLAEGLRELGNIPLHAGDPRDAVQFFQRSRAIYERLEDLAAVAIIRLNLGVAYARMGKWDESLAEFHSSLILHERMGNLWLVGMIQNNVGEVHRLRGDLREAIPAFERALAIWGEIGHAPGVALALTGLGGARVEAGEVEEGRANLLDAEGRFNALGRTMYFSDLNRFLASAELARGDLDAATKAAQRSLEFARAGSARHQEAMTQRVLAEIALARDDEPAARELLEMSRRTLTEFGEAGELARTEAILARLSAR